jgi:hypothetical protein
LSKTESIPTGKSETQLKVETQSKAVINVTEARFTLDQVIDLIDEVIQGYEDHAPTQYGWARIMNKHAKRGAETVRNHIIAMLGYSKSE